MIRYILFFAYIVFVCVFGLPVLLIAVLTHRGSSRAPGAVQWAVNVPMRFFYRIFGAQIEKSGEENKPEGAALYVCNHQGLLDIFMALTEVSPLCSIVAKKETESLPVVSWWMKSFDCVFIDRGNPREGLKAINRAAEILESGRSVFIFPEGTRSRGPEMAEFKHGAFKAAIKAGVPIVPIALDGTYKCYDLDHKIHPGKVKFALLPPISAEGKNTKEISAEVQGLIQAKLDEFRKE